MKTKIIGVALLISLSLGSIGCNKQIIDLDYNYNYALIDGVGEVKVKSWNDYENSDMIQVTDVDGVVYLTHSSRVILMKK